MARTLSLAIVSVLFLPLAARAQSTPQTAPPAQQPAKQSSAFEDDPQFKRLPPEQQKLVRQMMQSLDKAVAEDKKPGAPPSKAAPPAPSPNAQPGCAALPVKQPRFHLPKAVQDAINKQTKQIGKQTGVDLDPNAPAQTVKDAQKNTPCPPVTPAPGQPAANK